MKDKNTQKLIISIVAVLLIVGLVAGATFAYWNWATNSAQQTKVNFTVAAGLSASIDGGAITSETGLIPTSNCVLDVGTVTKEINIRYKNDTENKAKLKANLTMSEFQSTISSPTITDNDKSHIHWAITNNANSCTTPISSGTFDKLSNGILKESSKEATIVIDNIEAHADKTSSPVKYYLHIWLDQGYAGVPNEGNTIKDPMQALKMKFVWSGSIEGKN